MIRNKVIVITGASSGAGRAIALECASKGAWLVLAARRERALEELVKECEGLGTKAIGVRTDVTNAGEMKNLAKAAVDFGNHIDVWVNNAGVLAAGAFEETPVDIHDQVIRINLMGYIHGAHAVLPYFKQQGYGILINNISVGGWFPTPYATGYTASKFGLRGFSEALKGELHKWPHIHVCDLFPAFLDTPGIQHAANYTGRSLKPAPPVYDPGKVARAIASLVDQPKEETTIGAMSGFLRFAHFLFPGLSRRITANLVETYLKSANPLPVTPGNLYEPVAYGTSIYGGWQAQMAPKKKTLTQALLVAGMAAGFLLLRQGSKH